MKELSKKTKITAAVAVLLCGVIIIGVIFMLFNRGETKSADIGEITAFESLTLRFSGMRGSEEYEIMSNGDKAEISYYVIKYADGEEKRELEKSAECDTQEVIDILNECKAGKWNGFHGAHPKGVLDGRMFRLSASVNGSQELSAEGSQNFPKNFNTFEEWIRNKLY